MFLERPIEITAQTSHHRSKYSPFQRALRISKLPPTTRPAHLTHILSHPVSHGGLMGRPRDSGVNMYVPALMCLGES